MKMPRTPEPPLWAIVAGAIFLTVVSVVAIERLHQHSFDHVRASGILDRLASELNSQEALKYEALQTKKVGVALSRAVRASRTRAEDSLDELARLVSDEDATEINSLFRDYERTIDEELRLISAGRIQEAERLDEERVDTGFEALEKKIDVTSAKYERSAERSSAISDYGTGGVALLATLFGLALLLSYEKSRRAGQEALRSSEERFRSLIQNSSDIVTVVDAGGDITYQSPSIEHILGIKPEERIGKNIFEDSPVHPDDAAKRDEFFQRTVEGAPGATSRVEVRLLTSSGAVRYMEYTGKNLLEDPSVCGVVITSRDITERKEADQRVAEAEARYRALVENVPAVVYTQDLSNPSRTTYISPQIVDLQGYTAEEIMADGEHWAKRLHPDDRERVFAEDERTNETGEPFKIEYRQIARNGRVVWVRDEAVLIRDEDGNPLFWQGVLLDVTSRKEAEGALLKSEQRFRQLFNESVDIMLVHDEAGLILDCNSEAARCHGYSREEMIGLSITDLTEDLLSEDERKAKQRDGGTLWQRIVAGDLSASGAVHEGVHRRKDGTTFPVEVRVGGVEDYDGKWRILASIRDVTDRKEAESALRRSEAQNRAMVDAATDAIITMTTTGTIRSFNPAAERTFGYAADEVIGQPLRMLMPERFRGPHESGFRRYLGGGEAHVVGKGPVELAGLKKNGEEFPLELSLGEVREGDEFLFTGIVRDITERKKAEETSHRNSALVRLLGAVATAANEASSVEEAMCTALNEVCAFSGWPLGHIYLCDEEDGRLVPTGLWHDEEPERFGPFREATVGLRFGAGVGLPGRVLQSAGPVWISDLATDNRFPRARRASESGIRAGFAFPVLAGREVAAVLEFFSTEITEPDREMLEVMTQIGTQLGRVIERSQAAEALTESAAQNRTLIETASDAIVSFAPDSTILSFNPAAERIFGYTADEVVGESFNLLIPEDAREEITSNLHVLRTDPDLTVFERPLETMSRRRDGSLIFTEVSLSKTGIAGDLVFIGIVRDITERKRAEQALRENEERYRLVSQATNEVIWDNDFKSNTQRWDGAVEAMFGYSASEVGGGGEWWEEQIHPDDREEVLSSLQEVLDGSGESWSREYRFRRADGEYSTVVDRGYIVRDEGGDPVRMLGSMMDVTERRWAEEALRESEERFRGLADATFEGIVISERGWILETNRAFAEMFGFGPGEILGKKTLDFVAPESRELVRRSAELDLREPYEAVGLRRDGTRFDVEIRGRMSDYQGREVRVSAVRDITERKEAERRLQEAESSFRTLVEQTPAVTYIEALDGEGTRHDLDYVSPQIEKQLGYTPEEWTSDPDLWKSLLHPDDRERVLAEDSRTEATGEPFSMEYRIRHRDGRILWVQDEATLIHDDDGAPLYWQGVQIDITERKLAEEAVRQSETRLAEAQRMSHLGNWDWNISTGEISWSDEVFRIYGYEPGAFVPTLDRLKEIVHPEDRTAFAEALEGALHRNERYDYTHRILRPDGAERTVHRRANVTFDEAGNPVKMVGTVQDITERRRAEEELERAREAADAANRAKSDFLANMSHEIRTPMNGVIGMTELLLDTPLSPEQREFAETVRLSGESLLVIINDILDFSKIEAGEMRIETIDFDLRTVVEDIMSLLAEKAHGKGLELANLIEYDVPTALRGDPGRLRQVLTNLLGNAIKFTEAGEVVLRVEVAQESPDNATVRFEVTDTGIGISEEQRSNLFRSFSQADTSTTRKYGGTGLGLAICKQLVEIMGGEIGVTSEPGVGSTFSFELPLGKQPPEAQAARGTSRSLEGLRVLVVDDNATNRQILGKQLSSWGMVVESADGSLEGLQALRATAERGERHDLAVLDMQMPDVDGLTLARKIKEDPATSPTRLVLLTSMGRRGEGGEAREAGIEAYLTKPVRQSELYNALAAVVGATDDAAAEEKRLITRHSIREQQAGSRVRVLVAEDNPVNQKVAARMLEKLGYRVDVAENGLEALDALERNEYAAVMMDVQMPQMDGYEATAEIRWRERNAPGNRHIPIIAMTANAMQGDREKALQAGMDDYLPKPVKPEELREILESWAGEQEKDPENEQAFRGPQVAGDGMVLDLSVLAELRDLQEDGEPDLIAELADLFVQDSTLRLRALREAVENGNAGDVRDTAHTLKGSSGNMGALRMSRLAAELQNVGESGDLSRVPQLVERLEEEFDRVRLALDELAREQPA